MVLAAALCALTAFSYMELTAMFPRAGSEHEFARQVFPEWISFATGWAMAVALVVASAAVSLGFARYVQEFVPVDQHVASIGLLVFVVVVAMIGMHTAKRLVLVLSVIQVTGLLIVVLAGIDHVGDVDLLRGPGFGGILDGASLVFFAYIGFDEVITLAEETHDPRRTVPRALMLALGISTVLYVAVAVVAVSVLGPADLARSTQPLTDVIRGSIGGGAVDMVAAVALATTANTTLLATTASSRMIYSMANTGQLPSRLANVHDGRSPRTSIALVSCGAIVLSLVGGLDLLAEASNALVYVMFLVVNLVVIVLRFRRPDAERPFVVSFSVGQFPVVPALGIAATVLMACRLEVRPVVVAFVLLAIGVALHFTQERLRGTRARRNT